MFNFQNWNWKKIGLICGFILVCLVLGYLIYFLFFKPTITPPTEVSEQGELGQLPGAKQGAQPGVTGGEIPAALAPEAPAPIKSVTKIEAPALVSPAGEIAQGGVTKVATLDYQPATNLTLDPSGTQPITYNAETGKFYTIDNTGQKTLLTDRVYKNVKDIAWSPQKKQAVLEFPDGSNILYDFEKDKQISLPKDWTEFSFSPTGSNIAFKDMNNQKEYQFLGIANADGSGQKYLEPLGSKADNFVVDWSPNGKMIAEYKSGKTGTTSQIIFLGQYDEKFRSITVNGYGLETKWTPDGGKIIYSAHNVDSEHKPLLHIVEAAGDRIGFNHHSLKLNTWADKCTFADASTMYCAVPETLPYGAGLVKRIADETPDYIYKIDLNTGVKSFVAEPEVDYTIDQLQVSADGSNLYFTDKASKSLHLIKLK